LFYYYYYYYYFQFCDVGSLASYLKKDFSLLLGLLEKKLKIKKNNNLKYVSK